MRQSLSLLSLITFVLYMFVDSTALFGNKYGSGTGPIATVCSSDEFSHYSTNFSPFGNCNSSPLNLSCSHELDVGVRCSKGQGT